jgi:hypothetical protein
MLHLLLATFDFAIEVLFVTDDVQSGVALVSFLQLIVLVNSFINRFISRFVVNTRVEFFSSLSGGD